MVRTIFKVKNDGVTGYLVAYNKKGKWYSEAIFPKKKEAIEYIGSMKDESLWSRINKWFRAR